MSVTEKTHATIVTDMMWYDAQPDGLKALLREFSYDDVKKAQAMVGDSTNWEIIGRVLHVGRRLTMDSLLKKAA